MNNRLEIKTLCFTMEDIKHFSQISLDRNPLHISREYSRKTPYGQPVVFGVLCGIASMGFLPERSGQIVSKVIMDFYGPILLGVDYQVVLKKNHTSKVDISVYDGWREMLSLSINYLDLDKDITQFNDYNNTEGVKAVTNISITRDLKEFEEGITVEGDYMPSLQEIKSLAQKYNLLNKGITLCQISSLMCCSYIVGMELPGTNALFSKLDIDFTDLNTTGQNSLHYNAYSENFDKRFNLLNICGCISNNDKEFARVKLSSFVRKQPSKLTDQYNNIETSSILKGKVALVTGASRGLGSAITKSLVMRGCTVLVNYFSSHKEAEELKENLKDTEGKVVLVPGDISDLDYCEKLKDQIEKEFGKLDYLILNATPSLLPLWLEPSGLQRIHDYLIRSIKISSVPMAVFNELLSKSSGKQIFISSSAVKEATADWPHYVAAKSAIEGLVRTAALEYPDVQYSIVRFKKLLTDLTNTPMGSKGAISPDLAANELVEKINSLSGNRGEIVIFEFNENKELIK